MDTVTKVYDEITGVPSTTNMFYGAAAVAMSVYFAPFLVRTSPPHLTHISYAAAAVGFSTRS